MKQFSELLTRARKRIEEEKSLTQHPNRHLDKDCWQKMDELTRAHGFGGRSDATRLALAMLQIALEEEAKV